MALFGNSQGKRFNNESEDEPTGITPEQNKKKEETLGSFRRLSDFEKNLFLKKQIKEMDAEIKRLKSGEYLREKEVEIGKLTAEIHHLQDKTHLLHLEKKLGNQKRKLREQKDAIARLREQHFTRDEFMEFFRNDIKLNTLSVDDRIEVFSTILLGSSDITAKLLNDLIDDYCVEGLEVIEIKE